MATHRRATHFSKVQVLEGKDPQDLYNAYQRAGGVRTGQILGCWIRDQLRASSVGVDWGAVGESIEQAVNKK